LKKEGCRIGSSKKKNNGGGERKPSAECSRKTGKLFLKKGMARATYPWGREKHSDEIKKEAAEGKL